MAIPAPHSTYRSIKHLLSLGLTLAILWWVLSGYSKPLLLGFGAASVFFTLWLARRMDVVDHESHPLHLSPGLLFFWLRLFKEIVISNAQVIAIVLSPKLKISPQLLIVKTLQTTDLGKVIVSNAITLTPGTVTVDIEDDRLLIHALTNQSAKGAADGDLDRLIPMDVEPPQ